MKLGMLTAMYGDKPLKTVLELIRPLGLQTVELGTGNYPGDPHCPRKELLASKPKREELLALIKGEGLEISALSCHGNPIPPDPAFAKANAEVEKETILLAEMLGVKVVNGFSGCPGSDPKATLPNWVTCAWPPDYLQILDYQWNEVVFPYWKKQAQFLKDHDAVHRWCADNGHTVAGPRWEIYGDERVHVAYNLPGAVELAVELAEDTDVQSGAGVIVTGSVAITSGGSQLRRGSPFWWREAAANRA